MRSLAFVIILLGAVVAYLGWYGQVGAAKDALLKGKPAAASGSHTLPTIPAHPKGIQTIPAH